MSAHHYADNAAVTRASNCEVCGAELVRTGVAGRPSERFCSPACRRAWWNKRENRRPPVTTVAVERDDLELILDAWRTGRRGVLFAPAELAENRLRAALEEAEGG